MAATASRCRCARFTTTDSETHSTDTTTNIVAKLNCAHRRLGVSIECSLARGLAMSIRIRCRREEGKGSRAAGDRRMFLERAPAYYFAVASIAEPGAGRSSAGGHWACDPLSVVTFAMIP